MSFLEGPSDSKTVKYCYNDAAAGYSIQDDSAKTVEPKDLVLLIEQPGAEDNAHADIPIQGTARGEQGLFKLLHFPHYEFDPDNATTVILYASGTVAVRTRKDLKP